MSIANLPIKRFMLAAGPLNAMPFEAKLKLVQVAAKIGKQIPHPTVKAVSHTVDFAVDFIKQQQKKRKKKHITNLKIKSAPSPK